MSDAFLLCRRCRVLHPLITSSDPEDRADLSAFRAAHAAHAVEVAHRVPNSVIFEGPTWDPMSPRWLRVTTGDDELLVHSWRRSLDEPRRHELSAVPLHVSDAIELDLPLVRRALDRHFYPAAVRAAKLDRFVGVLNELVADLDPAEVEIAFDDPELANAGIGALPEPVADALLHRCAGVFDPVELERVRSFVHAHRYEDGVLALRVRRILNRTAA